MPCLGQGELEVLVGDVIDLRLRYCAAQIAVASLHFLDLQGKCRREAPDQDLGNISQQRGDGDLVNVEIVPDHGPFARPASGLARPGNHSQQPQQSLRVGFECLLDQRQLVKIPEEWADTNHHQCPLDGRYVRALALVALGLDIGQHAQGHQWILQNDRRQDAAVDVLGVVAQFVELLQRMSQYRQLCLDKIAHPRLQGRERDFKHGCNGLASGRRQRSPISLHCTIAARKWQPAGAATETVLAVGLEGR